jgi:hypothetical protein
LGFRSYYLADDEISGIVARATSPAGESTTHPTNAEGHQTPAAGPGDDRADTSASHGGHLPERAKLHGTGFCP